MNNYDYLHLKERILKSLRTKIPVGKSFCRMGSKHDGGYVVVDDFLKSDYLISFGIGYNLEFEKSLQPLIKSMDLYDNSISGLKTTILNSNFFKEKIEGNSDYIFNRVDSNSDIILKIDIEGYEWDFFENIKYDNIIKIKQIILEIHWMIENEYINVPECRVDILEKINKTHQLVSIHPNNYAGVVDIDNIKVPQVLELTYLRKKDYSFIDGSPSKEFFSPNSPDREDIVLKFNNDIL